MPSNRKNNHYHYAEKFEDRRRQPQKLFMPKRTAFVAALFLLVFGIVSTTFSAYIANTDPSDETGHSIIVNVRTAKAQKDVALTGANADLAATGKRFSGRIYWIDSDNWGGGELYLWNGAWNTTFSTKTISNTDIKYVDYSFSNYEYEGYKFRDDSSWAHQSSGDLGHDGSGPVWYEGANTTEYTDTSKLNGTASVTAMISFDGGSTYSAVSDSSNYATISGINFNYSSSQTGTVSSGGNTETSATATCWPAYGSTYTVSATPATNTTFKGFSTTQSFSGTPTISHTAGFSKKSTQINDSSQADDTWYAYFVVPTVTAAAINPSNITASTVTRSYSSSSGYSYVELTAPAVNAYEFDHWTFSTGTQTYASDYTDQTNPTQLRTDADCTATAHYKLKAPTSVSSTTFDGNIIVDEAAVRTLTVSATNNTSVQLRKTTSAVIKYDDDPDFDSCTTVAPSVAIVTIYGNPSELGYIQTYQFLAHTPGRYRVKFSTYIKDNTNNLTSDATESAEVVVNVIPAQPAWTLTMSGYDNGGAKDTTTYGAYGTVNNPYLVTLGSTFNFTASINSPINGYTYTWYNATDNSVIATTDSTDPTDGSTIHFNNQTASEATLSDVHVDLYCVVTYHDSYANADFTNTSEHHDIYYYIKSPIDYFRIPNIQKIYTGQQSVPMYIKYNIDSATGYVTTLYQSADNVNFYEAAVENGFLGTQLVNPPAELAGVYQYTAESEMYVAGPKYFYLNMSKTGANAKTEVLHTTVGATSSQAQRQLYFINSTGLDLSTYRVMAFYLDGNGAVKYQTAQDVFKGMNGTGNRAENIRYRVNIPSDATAVSFAAAKESRYSLPTWDTTTLKFTYSDNTFFYLYTDTVTLNGTFNTIKATGSAMVVEYDSVSGDPIYDAGSNPFYEVSGTNLTTLAYQTTTAQ